MASAPDLSARRRQELLSALRTIAKLLGSEPALIPLDPRLLVARLAEIAPAAHGLSRGRWNNIRSLLRAALDLAEPMMPGRHLEDLMPAWQVLLDALPTRRQRAILTRFLHHCSAAGIAPEMVDEAVMARFGAALQRSLLSSPSTQLRDTRGAWNRACRECPGWPDWPVDPVLRPEGYIPAWSALAPSLAADA
ncbi:hypothetical protein [Dankookia sp. P2]|uniref:hypothetical protein n=1 Tax=Dankookia sp. P2 TaxID=3423955 RepID=UPI003D6645B2